MKLRIWHIPQVPGKAFHREVESVKDGVLLLQTLASYDYFEFENNIKGDYCNAQGLELYDETLTDQNLVDMELEDRWVSWYFESDTDLGYFYFEDPEEYLSEFKGAE